MVSIVCWHEQTGRAELRLAAAPAVWQVAVAVAVSVEPRPGLPLARQGLLSQLNQIRDEDGDKDLPEQMPPTTFRFWTP